MYTQNITRRSFFTTIYKSCLLHLATEFAVHAVNTSLLLVVQPGGVWCSHHVPHVGSISTCSKHTFSTRCLLFTLFQFFTFFELFFERHTLLTIYSLCTRSHTMLAVHVVPHDVLTLHTMPHNACCSRCFSFSSKDTLSSRCTYFVSELLPKTYSQLDGEVVNRRLMAHCTFIGNWFVCTPSFLSLFHEMEYSKKKK